VKAVRDSTFLFNLDTILQSENGLEVINFLRCSVGTSCPTDENERTDMIIIVDTNKGRFIYRGRTEIDEEIVSDEIRKILKGVKSEWLSKIPDE
jgi:hypothetical protein